MKIFNQIINYTWIKDNIAIILLAPTFAGGFWQIMELARLDTSYVRFFSISQLVSDGLLILFVILIYSLAVSIILFLNKDFLRILILNKSESDSTSMAEKEFMLKDERHKSWRQPAWFVIIAIIGICIYFFYPLNQKSLSFPVIEGSILKPSNIFIISFYFGSISILIVAFIGSIFTVLGYKTNLHNKAFRRRVSYFRVFLPAFCLLLFIKLPSLFHREFLLPENLRNKAFILQKARTNNPKSQRVEIAYFNDKFVFIEVSYPKGIKTIEIMQFGDLFLTN